MSTKIHLSIVAFSKLDNWSVQYLLDNDFNYTDKYPLVKIGSFLSRNRTPISIEDGKTYKRVRIKINNGGVELRDMEKGENIGTKKQYLVKEGQFIFSRIDARNGAFGTIPKELEGAIVTNDFPVFDINPSIINVEYLVLITTTEEFVRYAQASSSGTTNRQRVDIKVFLEQIIPLPSLLEQNVIVETYKKRIQLAQRLERKSENLNRGIKEYLSKQLGLTLEDRQHKSFTKSKILQLYPYHLVKDRWDVYSERTSFKSDLYPLVKFESVIKSIATGTTPPSTRKEYFNGDICFYTPSDLGESMYLKHSERHISKSAIANNKARVFLKNTFLFVGIGSTIGKVGIVKNVIASSNQQITGMEIDQSKVNLEYLFYYFDTFKEITTKNKTQATIPILNQKGIRNIVFPLPNLDKQIQIVEYITDVKLQAAKLIRDSKANRKQAIIEFENTIFNLQ